MCLFFFYLLPRSLSASSQLLTPFAVSVAFVHRSVDCCLSTTSFFSDVLPVDLLFFPVSDFVIVPADY